MRRDTQRGRARPRCMRRGSARARAPWDRVHRPCSSNLFRGSRSEQGRCDESRPGRRQGGSGGGPRLPRRGSPIAREATEGSTAMPRATAVATLCLLVACAAVASGAGSPIGGDHGGPQRRWMADRVAFLEASSSSSTAMASSSSSSSASTSQLLLRRRALASQQSLQPTARQPPPGAVDVDPANAATESSSLLSSRVSPMVGGPRPWYDIRGMEKLPNCLATAERGSRLLNLSAALTAPCVPEDTLHPGDYLIVADRRDVTFGLDGAAARAAAARRDRDARRLVRVLPAHAPTRHALQLLLDRPWDQADAAGLAVFRVLLSADAIIARVRREGDVLRRVREGQLQGELADEGEEKAKARGEQEEKAKARGEQEEKAKARGEQEEKAKLRARGGPVQRNFTCEGGVWLPGEVAVVRGSPVVTTSADLRTEVPVGGRVWIANRTFVVTEPRDAITMTLSAPWPDEAGSASGLHVCRLLADNLTLDCPELSGCLSLIHDSFVARTSVDLTGEIVPGEVARILWANGSSPGATQEGILSAWENVTNSMFLRESRARGELFEATVTYPQDAQTLTLSGPWRGPSVSCVKACKPSHLYSVLSGGLIPLCGTVAVEHGGRVVHTTCDLRNVLNSGDWLRIGTETTVVTSPFTADKLAILTQFAGPSAAGLKAFKQSRDVPLSGTISVTAGSATLTTSSDLRAEVAPGDLIRIFQVPDRTDLFEVVLPQDMYTLSIAVPHPGPSAHGLKAYKVTGTEQMLSGVLSVTHGSTLIPTSMDLTGEVGVGDGVRIGNVDLTITNVLPPTAGGGGSGGDGATLATPGGGGANSVAGTGSVGRRRPGQLVTNRPWPGVTAQGLRAFKLGKSAEQEQLERLAAEKLRCTTIFCLAKIEERERALPFSFPRLLAGGDNASSGGSPALSADILFLNDTSSPIAQDYVPASPGAASSSAAAGGGAGAGGLAGAAGGGEADTDDAKKKKSGKGSNPRDGGEYGPSGKPEKGGPTSQYFNDWTQNKRDDLDLPPPP